ncbi:hypothetical protein [Pseudaestuariivita sp.]|uniref:hypothetical protein n=1 Tax=Pseudaestuariivita sp. TaxID=2211669 RepID=UPI00405A0F4C
MRLWLIAAVLLALAFGGWRLWEADQAARQAAMTQAVAEAVAGTRHSVLAEVDGWDVTLRGTFDTVAEADAVRARVAAVPDVALIVDAADVLPRGDPYVAELRRTDEGVAITGMVTDLATRDALAGLFGEPVSLEQRGGAPEGWDAALLAASEMLPSLEHGVIRMQGASVSVSGRVPGPEDRARLARLLADLPEGFSGTQNVELADDGRPISLTAAFDGTRVTLTGKVPQEVLQLLTDDARALGDVTGTLAPSRLAYDAALWPAIGRVGLEMLALLEEGALAVAGNVVNVSGLATAEAALRLDELRRSLPSDAVARLSLEVAPLVGPELE